MVEACAQRGSARRVLLIADQLGELGFVSDERFAQSRQVEIALRLGGAHAAPVGGASSGELDERVWCGLVADVRGKRLPSERAGLGA